MRCDEVDNDMVEDQEIHVRGVCVDVPIDVLLTEGCRGLVGYSNIGWSVQGCIEADFCDERVVLHFDLQRKICTLLDRSKPNI